MYGLGLRCYSQDAGKKRWQGEMLLLVLFIIDFINVTTISEYFSFSWIIKLFRSSPKPLRWANWSGFGGEVNVEGTWTRTSKYIFYNIYNLHTTTKMITTATTTNWRCTTSTFLIDNLHDDNLHMTTTTNDDDDRDTIDDDIQLIFSLIPLFLAK